jgi:hypothetical protein
VIVLDQDQAPNPKERDMRNGCSFALSSFSADTTVAKSVGWRRRYWRRYGVWPTGPGAVIEGEDGVAVVVPPGAPIIVSPVRPRSCGLYRYWNGWTCVDARYNDPYLGPR